MPLGATIITSGQLAALDSKWRSNRASIDSIQAHIIKTVDFEEITRWSLRERKDSLISDGKAVNKSNQNKDSYWINMDLFTTESTLNFSHGFLPNTFAAAHADLSSWPKI